MAMCSLLLYIVIFVTLSQVHPERASAAMGEENTEHLIPGLSHKDL